MSAKDQIKQIIDYFKREPQLKDKTDGMAEGLLLGAQLADDANELSKETDASFKALQREYTENGNGSQTTAEITVARDGELVLDDRLKRDFGNVNAQLAQKASINYVDAILMDIAKGGPNSGPQGPFMSIAALKAYDYPDGREGTWLVFDSSFSDGAHSFMWDSTNSVWKDLGVYQATGIADGTVTFEKLSQPLQEKTGYASLIEGYSLTKGYYINANSGNTIALAGSSASGYIPVAGMVMVLENYKESHNADSRGIAFYDKNKKALLNLGVPYPSGNPQRLEFTPPIGAKYMRFTLYDSMASTTNLYVKGLAEKTTELSLVQDQLKEDVSELNSTVSDSLEIKDIEIIKGGFVKHNNGGLQSYATLDYTDYTKIPRMTLVLKDYSGTHSPDYRGLAFYDKQKNYISGMQYDGKAEPLKFTPPENAEYIRFTIAPQYGDSVTLQIKSFWADVAQMMSAVEAPHDSNPLSNVIYHGGSAAILHEIGNIGDSLSSGAHEYIDESGNRKNMDIIEYSFPQRISKVTGNKVINFSFGGATAKKIWDRYAVDLGSVENLCQAYNIYLGTNDRNNTILGTINDINLSDYTQNSDTFFGNYGKIIQRILEVQPRAKVFCMNMPKGSTTDTKNEWNQAIESIVSLFSSNCYLIDVFEYFPVHDAEFKRKYNLGFHMNALGYQMYAYWWITYVDWIIRKYPEDFMGVAYIGTDYNYEDVNDNYYGR